MEANNTQAPTPKDDELAAPTEGTADAPTDQVEIVPGVLVPRSFAIDSMERLQWWLGKLADKRTERVRIEAQAAKMLKALDTDISSLERFAPEAEVFAAQELERRRSKRRTLDTLQGSVSFRTVPARVVLVKDGHLHPDLLEVAKAQGFLLTVSAVPETVKVDTQAYLKTAAATMKATGELMPGCEMTPERQTFSVTFKDEASDSERIGREAPASEAPAED